MENDDDTPDGITKPLFENNSTWWPPKLNPQITKFCHNLKNDILSSQNKTHRANLSKREFYALNQLIKNKDIIIKKGDKSSGVIIMNKVDYLNKIYSMLYDENVYTKTNIDDTHTVKTDADNLLKELNARHYINEKQLKCLTNFIPRCPIFYGIPKIHKNGNPLRPIVSQIDGPTSSISKYVSELLYVAEKEIPFLLQDTTTFLNLINKHKQLQPDTTLVTMDVTSLYINIPHIEGAEWVT